MNEHRVTFIAVALAAITAVFTIGVAVGRKPQNDGVLLISSESSISTASIESSSSSSESASSEDEKASKGYPIDLNKATADDLMSISGIGEKTAEKIIEYRHKIGRFSSIDQLLEIDGIGEKKIELIKQYVMIIS